MKTKKILACAVTLLMCFTAVSCSKSDSESSSEKSAESSSSSVSENSSSAAESSSADSEESSQTDEDSSTLSESAVETEQGEHIKKVYDFFKNENYTLKMTVTDSEEKVTEITRVVRGEDFFQLQKNNIGESGMVRVEDKTYDFNKVCGIYQNVTTTSLDNMIESVVDEQLPMTNTHVNEQDLEKYDVEEYTYTGDTYITILDFCFDKETGDLVKYTVTYSVEGEDDMTEVREIAEMSTEIDESVFNTDFTETLTDFSSLAEDQRLGYCQGVCNTAGVTTDEMYEFGIDTDKLKTISYDDFVSLVYTYGYND
ncbi:MAG: hypothetical protein ACI4I6_05445 [Hominimerdicola sp.]